MAQLRAAFRSPLALPRAHFPIAGGKRKRKRGGEGRRTKIKGVKLPWLGSSRCPLLGSPPRPPPPGPPAPARPPKERKEARALLVKDRNRIVAASVLGSPKLTETELIVFAQNRSIAEELLRVIAANRDWTKSYRIKLALVTNPKTPQPQAVHFIHHLQDRDLRALMKSKDVSTQVSAQARRILTKKGKL